MFVHTFQFSLLSFITFKRCILSFNDVEIGRILFNIFSHFSISSVGSYDETLYVKEWFVFPRNPLNEPKKVAPKPLNLPGAINIFSNLKMSMIDRLLFFSNSPV